MAVHDGSSSSSSGSSAYDVFLNFRDLCAGEEIRLALLEAIQRSKISIPVFSKGYADSKWCLQELVEIVRCHKFNGQIILPIFFDIEPTDVRHQFGSFEGSFKKHKEKFDAQTVMSWKEALTVAGEISGYELKQVNGNQSKLVDIVVDRVLRESSSNQLAGIKNPIGLDERVHDLLILLNSRFEGVPFVGICGIGGIGKTTIAMTLYNHIFKKFSRSSFLANVREKASGPNGLVFLQEQLIYSLTKKEVHDKILDVPSGKEWIKKRLKGENVLLILDDVDHDSQLDALAIECNWFGPASRIIITSRDEHILNLGKVEEDKIYRPKELDDEQSLHLFSLHAFSRDQPPKDYEQLSHDVVHLAGGLPLTLKVLGSSLFGIKEKEVWHSMSRKLKNIPPREVHQKLKISYDNLENDEKSIFLDAACFFVGWRKNIVISMWEACGFETVSAIKKLTQRSLLKFTNKVASDPYSVAMNAYSEVRKESYEELRMHDQIQAMGKGIVLEGGPRQLGNRSRLWCYDDILEVFEEQMGTPMIEGILPLTNDFFGKVYLHKEVFAMMPALRFLCINGASSKEVPHLPPNLRWFSWRSCPLKILPSNFYHKKLVHMDLSRSWMRGAWTNKPQLENQRFQKLKILILQNCQDLVESPDFSWFPNLEKLDLQYCKKLVTLHNSIGDLKSLMELHLYGTKIKDLPKSICKLSSLKRLILVDCHSLEKLPKSIGDLNSLEELDVDGTKIEELPYSICRLTSLKMLYLCPSIKKLPENICNLNSLVSFVLQIVSTRIESLPELPSTLTHLSIQNCISFQIVDFSSLKKLRSLRFFGCKSLEEIRGLDRTESLEYFQMYDCYTIESLSDLTWTLTTLEIGFCISLQKLPDLSSLKKLRKFILHNCNKLEEIEGFGGTESLEDFQLYACDTIESLPALSSTLTTLEIGSCISLQKLPDLSSLKKLRKFNLGHCKKLEEIRGLGGTESLEKFKLDYCDTIESLPELPSTLILMRVRDCNSLQKLPDLSSLKYLRILNLIRCKKLEKIRGLEGTESLAMLNVQFCNIITDTPRKIVGQGRLLVDELLRSDSLNVNDEIYKGLILCIVFAFPLGAQKVLEGQQVIIYLYSQAIIRGKHRRIKCRFELQIEDVEYTTKKDIIYVHHFKGFDWFGFPLEGKDAIEEIFFTAGPYKILLKSWKFLLKSKESEQQMPNSECSARLVADFFSWSFDNDERSPSDSGEDVDMASPSSSHGDGESSYHDGESLYYDCESSYGDGDSLYDE
ncbi:hypothetical protein NE237_033021 [Protea cynaroides]|uniref:TIR domain-containing protein n=1 Tax=Protea cynaroides TaxID=273540 RepID=A0A9Q0R3Y8_9MAGN|nr:hypothetical protein NE237_033021 [Protea cynaroides]